MIEIRLMREEDLDQVVLLDQMSFSLPWPPSAYRNELQNSGGRVWVAETILGEPLIFETPLEAPFAQIIRQAGDKAVIGVLVAWLIVDEAHIATLAVHPAMRRLGVGRKLLAYALADAAEQGMLTSLLEVRAGNLAAQKLYESFGFEVVGRRARYYHDNGEDALLMTLAKIDGATLDLAAGGKP